LHGFNYSNVEADPGLRGRVGGAGLDGDRSGGGVGGGGDAKSGVGGEGEGDAVWVPKTGMSSFLILGGQEETYDLGSVTIAIPQFWFELEKDASQSQICICGNENR
jgi:hypothetical protein